MREISPPAVFRSHFKGIRRAGGDDTKTKLAVTHNQSTLVVQVVVWTLLSLQEQKVKQRNTVSGELVTNVWINYNK